ncbi:MULTISPECIES: DUF2934 domain-containing protein [Pseudomonas]|uniref:DUF2934 domain-containing protein n=1 Tax=Pseudomonas oryzihabitans TaxID=47885 RepID=A0A178LBY7_9PSED|nr:MULTISPECIES: DUF2934 domain-containing protein [Pseudomonas]OAN26694.1 hypothetical protein A4V15_05930 [Pseudomonas oryzihabitans]SEP39137.1 Protein of unknown function [Pseudomonas sp. Snoq117.2]
MTQKDERIQQLAYQIWESEGRPAHEHDRHWEMATRLYEAEQEGVAKKTATKKPRATKITAGADTPVASKARTAGKTKSGSEKAATEAEATGESVTEKVESAAKKVASKVKQAVKPSASKTTATKTTASKAKADANVEATGVGVAPATPKKPRASRAKATTAKPAASE